jgi:hypothetical protein
MDVKGKYRGVVWGIIPAVAWRDWGKLRETCQDSWSTEHEAQRQTLDIHTRLSGKVYKKKVFLIKKVPHNDVRENFIF